MAESGVKIAKMYIFLLFSAVAIETTQNYCLLCKTTDWSQLGEQKTAKHKERGIRRSFTKNYEKYSISVSRQQSCGFFKARNTSVSSNKTHQEYFKKQPLFARAGVWFWLSSM